ncbi:hypothetical protein V8F20_002681 [Naviculisporaceae sp. PSN 640]
MTVLFLIAFDCSALLWRSFSARARGAQKYLWLGKFSLEGSSRGKQRRPSSFNWLFNPTKRDRRKFILALSVES